ncbi:MAG: formamidopyrimidine-DNA glycosylase, partial [Pelagibacterales bacterium]|nr:formamidopyrimidine-DNA glycosylase [Pelagibacterales bacterium]
MPELPEVETVVNAINKSLKSMTIGKFIIMNSKLRWDINKNIPDVVKNKNIQNI